MEPARTRRSREHWLTLGLALIAPLVLILLGAWLEPDPRGWGTHEQLGFRPCYPMQHWNLPCPGCGVTTAVSLAVRGRLLASLGTQPFGLVLVLSALGGACWAAVGHLRGRDLDLGRLTWRRGTLVLASLGLLAWLYKVGIVRGWLD